MTELSKNAQVPQCDKTDVSKRYFFNTTGINNSSCTERCMFKDNGTMIGSVNCQNCEHCIESEKPCELTGEVNWIICSKINLAKG